MGAGEAYLWVALGVGLSVLIPIVTRAVAQLVPGSPPQRSLEASPKNAGQKLWEFARLYLLVAVLSLLVAILIVAFVDFEDARAAIIGGYAWDATLQKIRRGSS